MKIRIFTDGACSDNPGPGGWAAIVNLKEETQIIKGYEVDTTNNRMELMAVTKALSALLDGDVNGFDKTKDKVEIHSDSAYVVNAINDKWTAKWKLNGWKTSKGNDVKNKDLWLELMNNISRFKAENIHLRFVKVKGHSGDVFNEKADAIARGQVEVAKSVS